jgi:hypothetical protein
LAYVFAHLGEAGYVLSLAPQAAILGAAGMLDLGGETAFVSGALRGRGWRWLPPARVLGISLTALLALVVIGWNVQAFLRGVGPGRLPDLRTRDLTTTAQVDFLRQQPPEHTLVLAHDILRQLEFYLPTYQVELLYSEYAPDWDRVRARNDLGSGIDEVVVLDTPVQVPPEDAGRVHEVVLNDQPRVSVAVVDVRGAHAIEHGYRYIHVLP